MSTLRREHYILIAILLFTAVFYFWALGRQDVITDESSYMVRGIHMLDFDFGIEQQTPIQWVNTVPWWMHLSFHDHPPLVFLAEYVAFKIFGENLVAGRIPSAFAGVLSVFLLFLIGKKLFSEKTGLLAAALFAVTTSHVWISRIALQESTEIALMLAAFYTLLRARHGVRWLYTMAVLTGFAFFSKYTAFILVPVLLTGIFIFWKDFQRFRKTHFLFSIFCFLIVISPVAIYNIGLYSQFGHFDFQFSYLFGQYVPAWQSMPGKESVGSLADRVQNFFPALLKENSPLFLVLAAAGLLGAFLRMRKRTPDTAPLRILLGTLAWFLLLVLAVGPTYRFLTLLAPWLALGGALAILWLLPYMKPYVPVGFIALVLGAETLYAYNSVIAISPVGTPPWTYAAVRSEADNWGFNQLESFIASELEGKMPTLAISFEYPAIKKILEDATIRDLKAGKIETPLMIVYDGNMAMSPQLWTFLRRVVYHGWPIADAETYRRILRNAGDDHFKKLGIQKVYFIAKTSIVPNREVISRPLTNDMDILEREATAKGASMQEIKNVKRETAFRVYTLAP